MKQAELKLDIRKARLTSRQVNFERINSTLVRTNFEAIQQLRKELYTWKEIVEIFKEQFAHVKNIERLAISSFQGAYSRLEKKVNAGFKLPKIEVMPEPTIVEKPLEENAVIQSSEHTEVEPTVTTVEVSNPTPQSSRVQVAQSTTKPLEVPEDPPNAISKSSEPTVQNTVSTPVLTTSETLKSRPTAAQQYEAIVDKEREGAAPPRRRKKS